MISFKGGNNWLKAGLLLAAALPVGCASQRPPPTAPPGRGEACLSQLEARHIDYQLAATPVSAGGCGIDNPVRINHSAIAWNRPAVMSCDLALTFDRFEEEVVQAAALRHFGKRVARIDHYGAFDCRRESSGHNRLSQHAFGNAIDVGGFILSDGTTIRVSEDWRSGGRGGAFLRDVVHNACRRFQVVLTPDSDARHRDHFHLDIGPHRLCGL